MGQTQCRVFGDGPLTIQDSFDRVRNQLLEKIHSIETNPYSLFENVRQRIAISCL
jgi:hypothetical protein